MPDKTRSSDSEALFKSFDAIRERSTERWTWFEKVLANSRRALDQSWDAIQPSTSTNGGKTFSLSSDAYLLISHSHRLSDGAQVAIQRAVHTTDLRWDVSCSRKIAGEMLTWFEIAKALGSRKDGLEG